MAVLGFGVFGSTVLGQPEPTSGGGGGPTDGDTATNYAVVTRSDATDTYLVGAVVPLRFTVTDEDDEPVDADAVTLTITRDGSIATAFAPAHTAGTGLYALDYLPATPGAYTARLVATGAHPGACEDVFYVIAVTAAALTVDLLRDYLGDTSASDDEISGALLAERYAQAARCRVDPYSPDLLEALCRRVARNLAARSVPVATFTSFEGGATSTRVPAQDAEVKRLEAPYRRRPIG